MAKFILVLLLSQLTSNGYWAWFAMDINFDISPFPLVPILSSVMLFVLFIKWLVEHWHE